MKTFMLVREPEAFELLADETRRKILHLLRAKDMTVSQLAADLGVTSQAVYHHVRKLLNGKMIKVAKEERVGHMIESYYRATAEDFWLTTLTGKIKTGNVRDKTMATEQMTAVLKAYQKLGLDINYDDSSISRLVDLWLGLQEANDHKCSRWQDRIWNTDDLSLLEKVLAAELSNFLLMGDEEFARNEKDRRELRTFLRSFTQKREKAIPAKLARAQRK